MTGGPGALSLPQDNNLSLTKLTAHSTGREHSGLSTPMNVKRSPSERKTPHMHPPGPFYLLPVSAGRRMQVAVTLGSQRERLYSWSHQGLPSFQDCQASMHLEAQKVGARGDR